MLYNVYNLKTKQATQHPFDEHHAKEAGIPLEILEDLTLGERHRLKLINKWNRLVTIGHNPEYFYYS